MRLLVLTQKVDKNDSILGFFHRWIEEFAKHSEHVIVVTLEEGKHDLPKNVSVYSLGKEKGASKVKILFTFYLLVFNLRHRYDAVFVHMNPEYVVLGGLLWRLLGKRVSLWYTHKSVDLKLRVAKLFANIIFTASKESFRVRTRKLHVMGHGIDTDFFSPDLNVARGDWYLSVGRLMPSKDHRMAIVEAKNDGKKLRIAGTGPELKDLEAFAHSLGAQVEFLGGMTQGALRDEYRKAALLIHTSKTGSLDKVVLEALACGLPVQTHDPATKSLANATPASVREHHSLKHLIPAIINELYGTTGK